MSGNSIIDKHWVNGDARTFAFIVNFTALGDVEKDGVFDYKAAKGDERSVFSTLFQQLERDAGPIDTLQISRHSNPANSSRIIVTSTAGISQAQAYRLQAVILQRIQPDMLEEWPLVDEAGLKAMEESKRAGRSEYTPTVSPESDPELYGMQLAVAISLKQTLPGVWKDGGDFTVMDVRPGEVDLIAEGACIGCPSSIEATTRKMFEDMALAISYPGIIQTPLHSLNVYTPDCNLAYAVRADGVYDARGQRTRIFQAPLPVSALTPSI